MTYQPRLTAGDPAPYFTQKSASNPQYAFDTAAGRYLVIAFLPSSQSNPSRRALAFAQSRADLFDDDFASFFAITADPLDESQARIQNRIPGFRVIWDGDLTATDAYCRRSDTETAPQTGVWVITDPRLRVIDSFEMRQDGQDIARISALLGQLPPIANYAGLALQAPILYLQQVFEPALCQHLIGLYEAQGGTESGFMRQVDGKTVGLMDRRHKSRRDIILADAALLNTIRNRISRKVVPEIAKAHQFQVTRMERYIVSCYDAAEGGHFSAHRDNTTLGTAHRRFAVSVNLNEDFEGGEVSFPEYGPRGFKAPAGGAVVFSCSLLHKVSAVTQGRRYAFLPFLYDDAAAEIRKKNLHSLAQAPQEAEAQ